MVDLELDDGLAIITIDRPHARNAISLETMDQLEKALDGAEGRARAGHHRRGRPRVRLRRRPQGTQRAAHRGATPRRWPSGCDRSATASPASPRPTIAALNGHALGGGAEFAVAADIRLAADDIKIGFNQVTLEIMPAWGGAERLVDAGRLQQGPAAGGHRHASSTPPKPSASAWSTRCYRAHRSTRTGGHRPALASRARRRDQARDEGRPHHGSRRGLCPAVGVRRTLGRRRQGDEPRQVGRPGPRCKPIARSTHLSRSRHSHGSSDGFRAPHPDGHVGLRLMHATADNLKIFLARTMPAKGGHCC